MGSRRHRGGKADGGTAGALGWIILCGAVILDCSSTALICSITPLKMVADLLVLLAVRLLLISTLGFAAVRFGRPRKFVSAAELKKSDDFTTSSNGLSEPLLEDANTAVDVEAPAAALSPQQLIEDARAFKAAEKRAHLTRNIVLSVLFVLVTATSVYTGIKCVTFGGYESFGTWSGRLQAGAFCLLVLLINVEFGYTKSVVYDQTEDPGVFVPKLHMHRLLFSPNLTLHFCDVCRNRIREEAYRCGTCDFDCCLACFKRQGSSKSEGLLRSDKGPKEEAVLSTPAYFFRALKLIFPFAHIVTGACLCVAATQGLTLLLPRLQGNIIDSLVNPNEEDFRKYVVLYVIFSVAAGLFGGVQSLCVEIVGRKLQNAVRVHAFRVVVGQDVAFFDGLTTGQIVSRLVSDAAAMVDPCRQLLNTMLANSILCAGGLVMCFLTSWQLSVLAFTSIGPIIYLSGLYAQWSRNINRQIWQALADANSTANETIGNIRTVKAFCAESSECDKYAEAQESALRKGMVDAYAGAGTFTLTRILDFATGVFILWYGGQVVLGWSGQESGDLSLGKLITFQLYWNMMNSAYQALNGVLNSLVRAAAAAQRVFALMECKPDIEQLPADTWAVSQGADAKKNRGRLNRTAREHLLSVVGGSANGSKDPISIRPTTSTEESPMTASQSTEDVTRPVTGEGDESAPYLSLAEGGPRESSPSNRIRGHIRFSNVWFTYQMRPEKPVLKGIDLDVPAGSMCAFVGRSGGGKSTLVHLMLRFYDPHEGQILVDGRDLREFDPSSFRSDVGVVAQETQLFAATIEENIAFGLQKHEYTREELEDAAKKAAAHGFISEMEEGYETRVGEKGVRLSGGQRQRLAIARVFLRKPRLLLLDEATSALDAESEREVQSALDSLVGDSVSVGPGGRGERQKRKQTIFLVAHRLSTVMGADLIAVVDEGRIVERGTHSQLLEKGGIYARLVQRQLQKSANEIDEKNLMTFDALASEEDKEEEERAKQNGEKGKEKDGDTKEESGEVLHGGLLLGGSAETEDGSGERGRRRKTGGRGG
uniref:Uncharacterized protein n=1 Tax=Chromera velia CCMP2878 TaxID=1169474 RepID=A0A0G4ICQ3_9ALVE|eukprot:Cvel_13215.t1-p1 / transcript=Cvel_13215.t1 / gene=Cvel_13215 / organism=Chromera_velia_CCMP2878 / gene_product=ATP-binding cassette sub-family B member 8,, putative / transcript_product=ATP-binding cassette sub-family B member 8,, putative / location=Cvel_scaffold894:52185-58720(-) / protein_length=1048 / sequence_SO=supercontig / SO=protein_coding / is_pseudo=false